MTQLTDKVYAVEVPDDLLSPEYCFEISIGRMLDLETEDDEFVIRHRERVCGSPIGKIDIPVPPGSYEFLFCTKGSSEEDARKVIESDKRGLKHYREDKGHVPRGFNSRYKTSTDSLASLLCSKGLDDKKNYALIRNL